MNFRKPSMQGTSAGSIAGAWVTVNHLAQQQSVSTGQVSSVSQDQGPRPSSPSPIKSNDSWKMQTKPPSSQITTGPHLSMPRVSSTELLGVFIGVANLKFDNCHTLKSHWVKALKVNPHNISRLTTTFNCYLHVTWSLSWVSHGAMFCHVIISTCVLVLYRLSTSVRKRWTGGSSNNSGQSVVSFLAAGQWHFRWC